MNRTSISSILLYLLSSLPFSVLYFISDILGFVLFRVIRYRKGVVRMNLRNSFPEKTPSELAEIERKFFKYLPDLIVEAVKMRTISKSEMEKRLILKNPEVLTQFLDAERPVVAVTAHYGNWEWGIYTLSLMTQHPLLIIYKPLTNQTFDKIFNDIRSRFGAIMVPMRQTLRKIMEHKDEAHTSVFVADQTPPYQGNDFAIEFLNQPTLVFTGAAKIARKINAPMVYCHIDRLKRGYYTCTFSTLSSEPTQSSVEELTLAYNRFAESIIRKRPELWLWSHNRWKRKPKNM
jgi:KDO2-lipid IV(A) lauroyltransferase